MDRLLSKRERAHLQRRKLVADAAYNVLWFISPLCVIVGYVAFRYDPEHPLALWLRLTIFAAFLAAAIALNVAMRRVPGARMRDTGYRIDRPYPDINRGQDVQIFFIAAVLLLFAILAWNGGVLAASAGFAAFGWWSLSRITDAELIRIGQRLDEARERIDARPGRGQE